TNFLLPPSIRLRPGQVSAKEREYIRVELLVKCDAVEARRVGTKFGAGFGHFRRARQGRGMVGGWHDMKIMRGRENLVGGSDVMRLDAIAALRRSPKLHRRLHRRIAVGVEEYSERIGDDCSFDAGVVGQRLVTNLSAKLRRLLTQPASRKEMRFGADQHEP